MDLGLTVSPMSYAPTRYHRLGLRHAGGCSGCEVVQTHHVCQCAGLLRQLCCVAGLCVLTLVFCVCSGQFGQHILRPSGRRRILGDRTATWPAPGDDAGRLLAVAAAPPEWDAAADRRLGLDVWRPSGAAPAGDADSVFPESPARRPTASDKQLRWSEDAPGSAAEECAQRPPPEGIQVPPLGTGSGLGCTA